MGPPPGLFAELSKWRDKAIKRGKPTPFASDVIPGWLSDELMTVQEVVGVEAAFSFLKQTPLDVRMAAERRIKRKIQAILKERQAQAVLAIQEGREFDYDGMAEELRAAVLPEVSSLVLDNAMRLSVDTGITFDPSILNTEALRWAREFSTEWAMKLTDTTRKQLQETLAAFIGTPGMTIGDIERLIAPTFGPVRAEMIAVTETTRAYSMATNQLYELLKQETPPELTIIRRWGTSGDDLVCPVCSPLNGQPENAWIGQFPDGPPAHVNCILPGNVVSVPGLIGGTQSLYIGRAIEIRTLNGRVLTVTENHPILTGQGWIAARLLNKGDDVIVCTTPEWIASSIYPDYNHMPTAIDEVFNSLKMSSAMASTRMPPSAEDFHGDGRSIYGNVHIVGPNCLLLGDVEARLMELLGKLSFNGNGTNEVLLMCESTLAFLRPGDISAACSGMSGSDLIAAALGRHMRPLDTFGSRGATGFNSMVKQDPPDRASVDTKLAAEFVRRFASLIATDEIVNVREFDFNGHVYDLQSGIYSLYTCNGVVVKNCRCDLILEFGSE